MPITYHGCNVAMSYVVGLRIIVFRKFCKLIKLAEFVSHFNDIIYIFTSFSSGLATHQRNAALCDAALKLELDKRQDLPREDNMVGMKTG